MFGGVLQVRVSCGKVWLKLCFPDVFIAPLTVWDIVQSWIGVKGVYWNVAQTLKKSGGWISKEGLVFCCHTLKFALTSNKADGHIQSIYVLSVHRWLQSLLIIYIRQVNVFSRSRNQLLFSHSQGKLLADFRSYVTKELVQSIVCQLVKIFMFP